MDTKSMNKKDFPNEVKGSLGKKQTKAADKNHSASVIWWIVGLLALLVIVFFIGLWAGKYTSQLVEDRSNNIEQERRQRVVDQNQVFVDYVTPEEQTQRFNEFFGN